jgi:periplasmic divalent cation tolerance protein
MPDPVEHCLVYITTSDLDEARRLAQSIVERRLAACANILPQMQSFYWWEGALEESSECVLLFKTRRSLVPALTDAIKAEHSYDCPCVLELPIQGGNRDFLAWIDNETVATPASDL